MKNVCLPIFIIINYVNSIEVYTKSGNIAGIVSKQENLTYYSFLGIPYAKPSIRFQAPQAIQKWNGTFNATKEKSQCPQLTDNPLNYGDEDCLYLNVYTPIGNNTKWPVIFWIHGGEFSFGSGHYNSFGPELFIKQNITVVTVNYRLGPFGFLCTNTKDVSCNSGLKDTVMALKWVKENIEAFNGDHNNICAAGESSGGVMVHYLLLSPMTENLINKAFISSGSAIGYRFFNNDCEKSTFMLSKIMGFPSNNITEVVAFLKASNITEIIKAMNVIKNTGKQGATVHQPFVPCAEKYNNTDNEALIMKSPIELIREGRVTNVPIITGFNTDEGIKMLPILYSDLTLLEDIDNDFQRVVPSDLNLEDDSQEKIDLSSEIKKFYFGDKRLSNETIKNYLDLIGDAMFKHSIDYWIRLISNYPKRQPIYYYEFKFDGVLNQFKIKNNLNYPGTSHSDDIGYYWITNETRGIKIDQNNISSFKMKHIFIQLLTNFMKTGNPTPKITTLLNTLWKPVSLKKPNYFLISDNLTLNSSPYPERMKFWRQIYGYQ